MQNSTPRPDALIVSDHPGVQAFSRRDAQKNNNDTAVARYYAVRDGFGYDPYRIDLSVKCMRASSVLAQGYGWCVPKAALLAAACRANGIPARVEIGRAHV